MQSGPAAKGWNCRHAYADLQRSVGMNQIMKAHSDRKLLDTFLSHTHYASPVDMKKLRFIYDVITAYSNEHNRELQTLRLLDVACGRGGIAFPLASLGCRVRAFDINESAVQFVTGRIGRSGITNLSVSIDDGNTFDDGETYDIVVASEVLEHVPDPARMLGNIKRRMTEGSRLIITTPNGYGPWELANRLNPRNVLGRWQWLRATLGKPPHAIVPGDAHCHHFTKRELLGICENLCLKPILFSNSDFILTIFSFLRSHPLFGRLDTKLADMVPSWMASGWYFAFSLEENNQ
jgi:2-polyprenyl-3-methyl-5-hydroxy-6-metoxy-1,4-benzoquinol methylase